MDAPIAVKRQLAPVDCCGLVLAEECRKVRVGALADLESAESLLGDVELCGSFRERDPEGLASLSQVRAGRERVRPPGEQGEYLVGDVTFEAANDVAIGEAF